MEGCVSSIPRWAYARSLASRKKKGDTADTPVGVSKAAKSIFSTTKKIMSGSDLLADYLIDDEELPSELRDVCSKSLLASSVYVLKSNQAYSPTAWSPVRRETTYEECNDLLGTSKCCDETGFQCKLAKFVSLRREGDDDSSGDTAAESLECASTFLSDGANGFSTKAAESGFSLSRMSGFTECFSFRNFQLTVNYTFPFYVIPRNFRFF